MIPPEGWVMLKALGMTIATLLGLAILVVLHA